MDHLVIVIPAYNEEAEIESVARGWHEMACLVGGESRLVIIDDGSKAGTYARLQALQAELPRLVPLTKPNSGHGATLLFGYRYALNMIESRKAVAGGEGDSWFVFQTDSDGQTDPAEFPGFWEKRHEADVIIGHRKGRQDGFSRIVVTKTLKLVLRLVFGIGITDANTPFRLMSSEALAGKIGSVPEDFNLSNVMLSVLFVRDASLRVRFLPITFKARHSGTNSINLRKIVRIGMRAVRDFARIRRELDAGDRK